MNPSFQLVCLVCGKGKGGAFRSINHDKCAKVLQEISASKKKHTTTKRITNSALDHFSRTGA